MAMVFELWAECRDAAGALRFADYFAGLRFPLMTGTSLAWEAAVGSGSGVSVTSPGIGHRGVLTVPDAVEVTEAGLRLLHHLLTAPDFRYAHLGWEASNIPMAELPDYVAIGADGSRLLGVDCVVDEDLWEGLGRPVDARPFRPGYRWCPYQGERYRPLFSQDHQELWALRERLLPN